MSAVEALKVARAAGVRVGVDGDELVLQAPAPPPASVIDLLSKHKSSIVALLQPAAKPPEPALAELPNLPKGAISEFEERASILEHDAGIAREAAERGAAVALGFASPDAFYTAVLASWRACIERVRPASPPVKKLKEASRLFLAGPYALQAVQNGWCELSLFGVFDGSSEAARNRLGARGLLPALAWSSLQLRLGDINREHATLISATGSIQRQRRFQSEIELATEWWRNNALLDGAAHDTTPAKGFYDTEY